MGWLLDSTSAFGKIRKEGRPSEPFSSIFDIEVPGIDGVPLNWDEFRGKYILWVNVASQCGFTGQYKGLQELYERHGDRLVVIGVPCNQFGSQEPGSEKEISEFCSTRFRVTFPMTAKLMVKGPSAHPLYTWLCSKRLNGLRDSTVRWNFQKYLVDPDGRLLDVFASHVAPESRKISRHLPGTKD